MSQPIKSIVTLIYVPISFSMSNVNRLIKPRKLSSNYIDQYNQIYPQQMLSIQIRIVQSKWDAAEFLLEEKSVAKHNKTKRGNKKRKRKSRPEETSSAAGGPVQWTVETVETVETSSNQKRNEVWNSMSVPIQPQNVG